MPFGLRMPQDVFEGCDEVIGIADDIVVYGKMEEDHDQDLQSMMKRRELSAENKLPHCDDNESLANAFADFFINKISDIREELQLEKNTVDDQFPEPPPYYGTKLCEFELVTTEELSKLIRSS
ncbi:hypothetical protein QZH41_010686, partial [Actinostola sp. cb2023]